MSHSLHLLVKLYEAHKDWLEKKIIEEAERWLGKYPTPDDPQGPRPYVSVLDGQDLFGDGMVDLFAADLPYGVGETPESEALWENISESDAEVETIMSNIWIRTLIRKDAERYKYIVLTFLDISIKGL